MGRVVDLPSEGLLLVATDMQGNLRDFERMAALFEDARSQRPDTYLVVTGDLVHGPELAPDEWPEHLGSFYLGQSDEVLLSAQALQTRHPGHVHYLLGNHEHAHLGGPVVGKFFRDEAARLETILGPERSSAVRTWFATWPLVAIAPVAKLCMLHAAPFAAIRTRADVDDIQLDELDSGAAADLPWRGVLGAILWARSTTPQRARSFLRALHPELTTAIHGHDVAREGFFVENMARLCLSTSFGCYDGDKLFLAWDLANPVGSPDDLLAAGALHRLWPESPPVYLDDRLR
jgi:hypothetical protein